MNGGKLGATSALIKRSMALGPGPGRLVWRFGEKRTERKPLADRADSCGPRPPSRSPSNRYVRFGSGADGRQIGQVREFRTSWSPLSRDSAPFRPSDRPCAVRRFGERRPGENAQRAFRKSAGPSRSGARPPNRRVQQPRRGGGEFSGVGDWRRERNWDPTFFANRVVWRNILQALPLAADGTAGRLHSSLRGRRWGRRKVGPEEGSTHQSLKARADRQVKRQQQNVGRCRRALRPAGRIRRSGFRDLSFRLLLLPTLVLPRRRHPCSTGMACRRSTSDA